VGAEYSLTAVTCTFAGNPGRGYPRFGHVQEIHPIPRPVVSPDSPSSHLADLAPAFSSGRSELRPVSRTPTPDRRPARTHHQARLRESPPGIPPRTRWAATPRAPVGRQNSATRV